MNIGAVYVLWLRDVKRFIRARSRLAGSLGMPLFFLVFLGFGFRSARFPGVDIDYMEFLIPGIIAMVLLFSSTFSGISIIWDRQFGFLREIMVTPVSRTSIVTGRMLGGTTTSLIQGMVILLLGGVKGMQIEGMIFAIPLMILISLGFVGMGIAFASVMEDTHGFQLVMNFVVFPIFFLSGSLYPVEILPSILKHAALINPLTYGVDALRNVLTGFHTFPLYLDIFVCIMFVFFTLLLSSFLFNRAEVG